MDNWIPEELRYVEPSHIEKIAEGCWVDKVFNKYFDHEKFAKLIIAECINEIAYIGKANEVFGDKDDVSIQWTTATAIQNIEKRFGVNDE